MRQYVCVASCRTVAECRHLHLIRQTWSYLCTTIMTLLCALNLPVRNEFTWQIQQCAHMKLCRRTTPIIKVVVSIGYSSVCVCAVCENWGMNYYPQAVMIAFNSTTVRRTHSSYNITHSKYQILSIASIQTHTVQTFKEQLNLNDTYKRLGWLINFCILRSLAGIGLHSRKPP